LVEQQQRNEQQIAQLIEGQRRQEELITKNTEQIARLVEQQQRNEQQIAQLIEGQRRHEELIAQLIEGQRRHEELIAQLIEGQRRHEELIAKNTELIAQLVEGQRQHSQRIERLEQAFEELRQEFKELRSEMGRITQALGLTVEEHAEDILLTVMNRKGWKLVRGPNSFATDGELDLIAVFEDPEGRQRTVLMEVKLRLSRREVEAWADRVRSEGFITKLQEHGFTAPYHPYLFGFRVDVAADEGARQRRMGLITSRGEILEPEIIEQV